jgi:prevent-host-death family protein
MISVGVARLKASLSAYLARVKAGEVVVVTEHGRPIARLVPAPSLGTDADKHLAQMERSGLLKRGQGGIAAVVVGMPRSRDPQGASLGALLAERTGDR